MTVQAKLLIGRFLTRSGDQEWDFAVPITLLKIFPDQLRIAALYYFLVKLAAVIFLPRVATIIDTRPKLTVAKTGLVLQLLGVVFGAIAILELWS